jgi:hypothetical protein
MNNSKTGEVLTYSPNMMIFRHDHDEAVPNGCFHHYVDEIIPKLSMIENRVVEMGVSRSWHSCGSGLLQLTPVSSATRQVFHDILPFHFPKLGQPIKLTVAARHHHHQKQPRSGRILSRINIAFVSRAEYNCLYTG